MKKIVVFISFVLMVSGLVFAEETKKAVSELTMHQTILQKIRAQSKTAQPVDLSQLIQESDAKAKDADDTHRDHNAEVQKIFDSLY